MIIRCPKCGAPVVSIRGIDDPVSVEQPLVAGGPPIGDKMGITPSNLKDALGTSACKSYDELPAMVANNDIARTILLRALSLASASAATPRTPGNADTSPASQP